MRQVAVEQRPLLVGHALHQKAVVRHQDQRAGPAVQQVLDNREHVGIQVVARLVQDEHVGLVQNRQQQRQATALAARKIADAAPELLRRKAQTLAELLGRSLLAVDDVVLLIVAEHLADRVAHVGLELLELLRQHAKAHCLANLHAAARGFNLALDHVEQRRLTGAVLAQKAIAVARTNEPGHIGEHLLGRAVGIGIAGIHVDHIDNLLAQAAHGQALELQLVTHGRHVGDQLTSGIHAKLGLGGTSLGTAAQPRELLARHVATALLGNRGHAVALYALQDVGRIAALEGIDLAVVDLPHAGADLVQEPAVVRDHEHGALTALPAGLKVTREPVDGAHVQVVGGLVEHEHVVVTNQQAREVHATALAARKLANRALPGHIANKTGENLARAGARRPLVLRRVAHNGMMHGIGVDKLVLLAEQTNRGAATVRHAAVVGLQRAGEHAQQRRLAVAVFADNTNAVALAHAERHAIENMLGGKL